MTEGGERPEVGITENGCRSGPLARRGAGRSRGRRRSRRTTAGQWITQIGAESRKSLYQGAVSSLLFSSG